MKSEEVQYASYLPSGTEIACTYPAELLWKSAQTQSSLKLRIGMETHCCWII